MTIYTILTLSFMLMLFMCSSHRLTNKYSWLSFTIATAIWPIFLFGAFLVAIGVINVQGD